MTLSGHSELTASCLKDESAATAIEYGLIATGIAVAIIPVALHHLESPTTVSRVGKPAFDELADAMKLTARNYLT